MKIEYLLHAPRTGEPYGNIFVRFFPHEDVSEVERLSDMLEAEMAKIVHKKMQQVHTPRTGITQAVRLLREMYLIKHSDPNKEDPIVTEMVEVLRKHGFDLDSPDKKGLTSSQR